MAIFYNSFFMEQKCLGNKHASCDFLGAGEGVWSLSLSSYHVHSLVKGGRPPVDTEQQQTE